MRSGSSMIKHRTARNHGVLVKEEPSPWKCRCVTGFERKTRRQETEHCPYKRPSKGACALVSLLQNRIWPRISKDYT